MIIRATADIAITIAMKISRRHPARKPFGPMKIRLLVESAGGVWGSCRIVVSSAVIDVPPQLLFTEQGFYKFQWRKNRRAEDWRRYRPAVTTPTGVLTSNVPFHVPQ